METINRIKKLSKERGISLSFLCKEMSVNRTYFIDLEKRHGTIPDDKLAKIAYTLFTSVEYLKGETDDNPHLPYPRETLSPIDFNLSQIFNPNNTLTRYASHIWEALNEIYSSNILFNDLLSRKPFGRHYDWVVAFKYCIVVLDEAAKILFIDDVTLNKNFEEVRELLLDTEKAKEDYNEALSLWKRNKQFFNDIRNHTVHFDHEKKQYFSKFINNTKKYTLYTYKNIICDFPEPIYLELLSNIYQSIFSNSENDIEITIKEVSSLLDSTMKLLTKMFFCYLDNYLEIQDNLVVLKQEKIQEIKKYNAINNTATENKKITLKSEEEKQLITAFRSLSTEDQERYLDEISSAAKKYEKDKNDNVDFEILSRERVAYAPKKNDDKCGR